MNKNNDIQRAKEGDINAFQHLFSEFQDSLKSYLFRILADRSGAEDIAHDTFIKAYDKLNTFNGKASLKTWVFQIATNLAYNAIKRRSRWTSNVSEKAKELVTSDPKLAYKIERVHQTSAYGTYEIKEHIDTCFTCISKNLPIENQIALLLKDVYDFLLEEIMMILNKSEGQVKYLLQSARSSMTNVFDSRCALVNKKGICHQCSELNGWFNPKQNQQEEKMKIKMAKESTNLNKEALFQMRVEMVKAINPLKSDGNDLQEALLNCNRMAMGEIKVE